MPAFALAHLHTSKNNDDIVEYIDKIQATLDPYQGRFRVHGGTPEVIEGEWPGTVVIIEFPDVEHARDWYASPAYQEILPLRLRHLPGSAIIIQGVGPDYDPRRTAAKLREAAG
ncbi:DUF1330 domain-containing protein [Micromonospora soli]|uniref:DUF1330 domain-containing protein n=1 Tax=Micromonospora sp. NBRC 110009 TaxID=3061627 RepID=UPI00267312E6|nr:DUF1330 domain-containing protein [Micromonospora sp. NBRC 110009]WKT99835.1 DUF1330 domain-containing protein [Micromonospora sp. NBRC 110009]